MTRRLRNVVAFRSRDLAATVALGIVATACYVAQGVFLALAVGDVLRTTQREQALLWLLAAAGAILLRAGVVCASEAAARGAAHRIKADLRRRLLTHLLALGPAGTARHSTGSLQATIVAGVEALEGYHSRYLPALIVAAAGCGGVVIVLAWVDWVSALILLAFVIAFPLADRLWLWWQGPQLSGVFAAMGAFGSYLIESMRGIVVLKAFGASRRRRAALAQRAAVLRRESMATLASTLMRSGVTGFIALGGMACVVAVNAWRAASGELPALTLLLTLFLVREAFRPLERLEREHHTAWASAGAIEAVESLLALRPPVSEPVVPVPLTDRHDIEFHGVDFRYEGAGDAALDAVSFTIEEGESVALVGPSGAGKSTLIALMLRFLDPTRGTIRLGGTDLRSVSLEALRTRISVVSQDPFLFHGTIEENLRLAKPTASLDDIRAAARVAQIDDFIMTQPDGYATRIGERGALLSGGQRQRLSIARAVLKDAPVLILDEATSSVDGATERAIQAAVTAAQGRRTVLMVAHRLSSIGSVDRVLVLENGRLVEHGRPAQLAQSGGVFARLLSAQGDAP